SKPWKDVRTVSVIGTACKRGVNSSRSASGAPISAAKHRSAAGAGIMEARGAHAMTPSQPTSGQPRAETIPRSGQADCVQRRRLHGTCGGCLVRELAPCSAIPPEETHALEELGGQV